MYERALYSIKQQTQKAETTSTFLFVRMVNRCVAAGCSNTPGEGISLYKFPSDPELREKWIKQVRRTRAQWKVTKYSFICSEHFTEDSFEVDSTIAATFGIEKRGG